VHPIAFEIGPLKVHWYGILMAVGLVAGFWTASRRGLRDGLNPETLTDLVLWLMLGAIIGARAWHVISYWREDFAGKSFWAIFKLNEGGLVFYGGLIGASLAVILYTRVKKLPLRKIADILSPSVALGSAFGRFGCLMTGCCYGRQCDLPWAVRFSADHASKGLAVHPTQIYDSLLNLGLYVTMAWLYRRKKFDGQVFAVFLMSYAVTRSLVELFRGDYPAGHLHGGLTPAQLVSIVIFLAGVVLFWVLPRPAKPTPV